MKLLRSISLVFGTLSLLGCVSAEPTRPPPIGPLLSEDEDFTAEEVASLEAEQKCINAKIIQYSRIHGSPKELGELVAYACNQESRASSKVWSRGDKHTEMELLKFAIFTNTVKAERAIAELKSQQR